MRRATVIFVFSTGWNSGTGESLTSQSISVSGATIDEVLAKIKGHIEQYSNTALYISHSLHWEE